jgi:GNAT acetyltransferase-like protein
MGMVLIQNADEVSDHYEDIKAFVDMTQPKYSSHVIDALMQWFESFSSENSSTFASRRGLNFYGRRSTLSSPFFLLHYEADELVAFSPFFRFMVNFGDGPECLEVISFSPDSTIFFYNDILIKNGCEASAIQTICEFFRDYSSAIPHIVLLNHIPSTSTNLPLLLKHSTDLSPQGFNVGISPVFRRGGLYPWNLASLRSALKSALENRNLSATTAERICAVIDKIETTSKTMLVFKKNHFHLKSALYSIFSDSDPADNLLDLYNAIESIFQSSPVKYPYLTLPESAEKFADSLSSSKRYYYRRYRKQYLDNGGEFLKLHGDAITGQDIDDFISLHRERWGSGSNILNNATASFLSSFLRILARNDLLTLFFAVHDSSRIACLCCIDFKTRREFLSSGRALEAENLRAGKLLIYESILDSIDAGHDHFDFGYGDEAYKSDFNWSYTTNNAIVLFYKLNPKQFPNILPLYEELLL